MEDLLVQVVAVAGSAAVAGVSAGDVAGLARDSSRIAKVRMPRPGRVNRGALQEGGQFLDSRVAVVKVSAVVGLDERVREDDLIAVPVDKQVQHREAQGSQPLGTGLVTATEVIGGKACSALVPPWFPGPDSGRPEADRCLRYESAVRPAMRGGWPGALVVGLPGRLRSSSAGLWAWSAPGLTE